MRPRPRAMNRHVGRSRPGCAGLGALPACSGLITTPVPREGIAAGACMPPLGDAAPPCGDGSVRKWPRYQRCARPSPAKCGIAHQSCSEGMHGLLTGATLQLEPTGLDRPSAANLPRGGGGRGRVGPCSGRRAVQPASLSPAVAFPTIYRARGASLVPHLLRRPCTTKFAAGAEVVRLSLSALNHACVPRNRQGRRKGRGRRTAMASAATAP